MFDEDQLHLHCHSGGREMAAPKCSEETYSVLSHLTRSSFLKEFKNANS